jgi:hypothetical protein
VLKGAFLSLKKKNKEWNISNIPKSKKNLPSHLTHHSRVQYPRGRNPSPGDIPKEKKRKGMLVTFSNQKKIPLPTFNLLKSEVQVQETFLKKKRKGNVSNVPKS